MINIALRFDDPSVSSDHALEKEIIEICKRHGVKINFAVIPYKNIDQKITPLNCIAAKHLIDAEKNGWIEISQHGHSHQNHAPANNGPSEFLGSPLKDQLALLQSGKALLDSLFINKDRGLVPPWNNFDHNTLLAARQLGFSFVSGGWEIPKDYKNTGIKILPRTGQAYNLCNEAEANRHHSRLSPILIAVLHHYDFSESNSSESKFNLLEFESILKSVTTMKHARVTSIENIASKLTPRHLYFGHGIHRLTTEKLNWRFQKYLPASLLFQNPLKKQL